jgi:PAS domain-containing protein
LADAPKNAELFPAFSPELGDMMKDETLLLLYEIIWDRDADFREVFSARHTYVNDTLADLYGIPSPGTGALFSKVDWPEDQHRAGYTSQGSFLTWQSGPRRNSPTKRGLYIQERILCSDIPPPDPNVDLELPEGEDLTLKELLEMHLENPGCATCHAQTDPLGFAFERYDAIGAPRDTDNGKPVETDGQVPGIGEWDNASELGDILAADPRTGNCLIENLMRGTLGQSITEDSLPGVQDLGLTFAEGGYSVQTLLVDMAAHPLFRLVDEPK